MAALAYASLASSILKPKRFKKPLSRPTVEACVRSMASVISPMQANCKLDFFTESRQGTRPATYQWLPDTLPTARLRSAR